MATSVHRVVQFGNFTEDEVLDLFSKDVGELEVARASLSLSLSLFRSCKVH